MLLARNPQRIRSFAVSVCTEEHAAKTIFKEVCWEGVDWIDLDY